MEKELHKLINIVRDHLHLGPEEIVGFVEKSLDPYEWREVVEHLDACPYCATEVDLFGKIVEDIPTSDSVEVEDGEASGCVTERPPLTIIPEAVPSPFLPRDVGEVGRGDPASTHAIAMLEPIADVLVRERRRVWRFWIGDRFYPLQRVSVCAALLEVVGLSVNELLRAILDDVRDLGSVPGGVEISSRRPVVMPLADLVPASGSMESLQEIGLKAQPDLQLNPERIFLGEGPCPPSLVPSPLVLAPHHERLLEDGETAPKKSEGGSDLSRRRALSKPRAGSGHSLEEEDSGSVPRKDRVEGGEGMKSKNMLALEFRYSAPGHLLAILADRQTNKVYLRITASL